MSVVNVDSVKSLSGFLTSIFFLNKSKTEKYNFGSSDVDKFGFGVTFKSNNLGTSSLQGAGFVSTLANVCRRNYLFQILTTTGVHIFAHEVGHALFAYLFTDRGSEIIIKFDQCAGVTITPFCTTKLANWKQTIIGMAGPMADVTLCALKLVAAYALKMLSSSIAPSSNVAAAGLSLTSGILVFGACIWMLGELTYAFCGAVHSMRQDDSGEEDDFRMIANRGKFHLAGASLALVTQCALVAGTAMKYLF
jgi:hypothetical protein